MGNKIYIGIDNGVSGTIGIINDSITFYYKTPVFMVQDYTKKIKNINRIDTAKLEELLSPLKNNSFAVLERPMVNPRQFNATLSGIRALEATLIVLERLEIPYQILDSKEWQSELLPKGTNNKLDKKATKKVSLDVGNRLFPKFKDFKHDDRDGLLMAEYARRKLL